MADASRLKSLRRQGLGAPPPLEEARTDLAPAPEPPAPPGPASSADPVASAAVAQGTDPALAPPGKEHRDAAAGRSRLGRIDGRTLRRSGRTEQFATRVTTEFKDRIHEIAEEDGVLLVEVLEEALKAYEEKRQKRS